MTKQPRPSRARMTPGYGITDTPRDADWNEITAKIERSRNYWVCTTRRDGRAHAIPVWGLWLDDAVYFSTDPQSVKGQNLRRRPDVVVHLESGDDVVIIEGKVERVTDHETLVRFADAYNAKYAFRPDPDDQSGLTLRLAPVVVHTWTEQDFPNSAMRWDFDEQ